MPKQLETDIRTAFDRAVEDAASPDELLSTVRALVRELKKEGQPPESVIVAIKNLCGMSQMTVAADTDSSIDFSASKKISDLVVNTVIDEYFKGARTNAHRPWLGYSLEIGDELR